MPGDLVGALLHDEGGSDYRCMVCRHGAFEQGDDLLDVVCTTCRSVLRLVIEPTDEQGASVKLPRE